MLLLLAACQSPPLSPEAGGRVARPTADFTTANGPAAPGHSMVTRFNGGVFLTSVDEEHDLVVRHYNVEDFVACGGSSPVPPSDAQLVVTPHASIYVWQTGTIPVYVYRLSEVPPGVASPELCADLATKWIYRGTHQLLNHDNNLTFDPSHTDAFGWNGHGTVYDRAGKAYRYHESSLTVVDTDPFRVVRQNYSLSIH
jgi:hypothetical protein